MNRVLMVWCVISAAFLSSCGVYATRQKQVLYDQIVVTNDTLDKLTRQWHTLLEKAVHTKNFSALSANRIQIGQYLSRRRSAIANLELPADAETLRGSEEVFLTSQAAMVSDVYPKFEVYNELTPDSTIQNQLRSISNDMQTEVAWKLTIQKSLDAFAQKNKFKPKK